MSLLTIFTLWVLGFGSLSHIAKFAIEQRVNALKIPIILRYYLVLTPIVLLEEALTIEVPYFWGVLPILFAFYLLFLVVYLFQRYLLKSYISAIILAGALGWINEFIIVGRVHKIQNALILGVISLICFSIYAVMAIIPSYILQEHLKRLGRQKNNG